MAQRLKVIVIEAGPDYTERVDSWEMDLPDEEDQAVRKASSIYTRSCLTTRRNASSPAGDRIIFFITIVPVE